MTSPRPRRGAAGSLVVAALAALGFAPAAPAQAPFASTTASDGVRIAYRVVGDGEQTVIAPFASLHGDRLDPLARGRRLVLYDPRGRGRSERVPPSKVSMELLQRDLEAVAGAVGAERFALIGWSGMGMELWVYARRHPERVTRLVQLAPVPPRRTPWMARMMANRGERADSTAVRDLEALQASAEADPVALCRAEKRAHQGATFADPASAREAPDLCELETERAAHLGPYFEALLGSMGEFDWRPELPAVGIPRLVVHGARDNIPVAGNREWVAGQPNARILVVEGAGHWPHYEQPQVTLPAIDAFLAGEWPEAAEALPAGTPRLLASVDGFDVPETALFDSVADVFLVSNVQGHGTRADGGGFISRVGVDGTVVDRRFIAGGVGGVTLNGPKGMTLRGDTLWVADVDVVRTFDRATGAPLASVDLSTLGARFLNDVAADADGFLYVTDTGLVFPESGPPSHAGPDRIFRIAPDGRASVGLEGDGLAAPNGIEWDPEGRRLLVGPLNGDALLSWRPGDFAPAIVAHGPGGYDGIEIVSSDSVLVSSLDDNAVHVLVGDRFATLIPDLAAPANIGFDRRRRIVAIPLLDANRVELWQLDGPTPASR